MTTAIHYVLYLPEQGAIYEFGFCLQSDWPHIEHSAREAGLQALQVDSEPGLNSYVDLATLTVQPCQDYRLEALPLPCTLTIEGVQYPCDQQPEISFERPGSYQIAVDAGPAWLKKTFTVEQTD